MRKLHPAWAGLLLAVLAASLPARAAGQSAPRPFRHASHARIECVTCHSSSESHGTLRLTRPRDCEFCHHRNGAARDCAACHATMRDGSRTFDVAVTLHVADIEKPAILPFEHVRHGTIACAECHTRSPSMAAGPPTCAACHAEHHGEARTCARCHAAPAQSVHDVDSHLTCSGSGCHASAFLEGSSRRRDVCVSCHRQQQDHRPGESCAECHVLPPVRAVRDGGR